MDKTIAQLVLAVVLLYEVHSSTKKGLCFDPRNLKCNDFEVFDNINWWYDWSANLDLIESESGCTIGANDRAKHVAMIWGYNSNWKSSVFRVDESNSYILAFNEPNHNAQSNLSPQEAVDAWPYFEQIANGRKIVSPAAAPCGSGCNGGNTEAWFDEFFRLLCVNESTNPCRVDYLATHVYKCKALGTITFLQTLYNKYGLKIWLTEFACPESVHEDQQYDYMEAVLPLLEKADYVFKYSWYMHRSEAPFSDFVNSHVSLLEPGSSTLTRLGVLYNDFGRTTTSSTSTSSTTSTTSSTASTTSATASTTSSTASTTSSTASTTSSTASTTSSTLDSGTTINESNTICLILLNILTLHMFFFTPF